MVRRYVHVLILAACGDGAPDPGDAPLGSHRIAMPDVALAAAEERTQCSHHVLPDLPAIERISYYGTAPVHGITIELEPAPTLPDGAIDPTCAMTDRAVTLFSSRRQIDELVLPAGAPLRLASGITIVLRVHFLNPDDAPAVGELFVDLHPSTTPPPATSGLWGATRFDFAVPLGMSEQETRCRIPPGRDVAAVYPSARRLAYQVTVRDDAADLVSTYDWEHPASASWEPPRVPAGDVVARCNLLNQSGAPSAGGPTLADERCGVSLLVVPGEDVASCFVP